MKHWGRIILVIPVIFQLIAACTPAKAAPTSEIRPDLESYFKDRTSAFLLFDPSTNHSIRYNPERCAEGFLPASTFKIMNAMIGLETGVIPDENFLIPWDGTQYTVKEWNQDHTLKSAIKFSVVWYFQELARRVGKGKIQQYVDAVGYGNRDISGNPDSFWLDGSLRISADQQVEFLKRLYSGDLPFSERSMNIVKDLIIQEKTNDYTLRGKTGSVVRADKYQGWFVGWLETKDDVYFFATNLETTNPDGFANGIEAQRISVSILKHLEIIQ